MTRHSERRHRSTLMSFRKTIRSSGSGRRSGQLLARLPAGLLVVIVVVGLVIVMVARRVSRPKMVDSAVPMSAYGELPPNAKADTTWDQRWPTLTIGGFPARPLEHLREAYAFAARRPDILRYVLCYCGCHRFGHGSNEACYVRRRTEDGIPSWNSHGVTCGVCVDVTRDVAGMIAEQRPLGEIRRTIDVKYLAAFGQSTATPNPPAAR